MSATVKPRVSRNPAIVRTRILDAAQAEFMEVGFTGASSNSILRRFGGSKPTMFRYFPTMRALFEGVVARIASRWSDSIALDELPDTTPDVWLNAFAVHAAKWILSEENLFVGRSAIADGHLFPEVQGEYLRIAIRPIEAAVTNQIAAWVKEGRINSAEPEKDAEHFFDLAFAGLVSRRLYRTIEPMDDHLIEQHMARCVEIFLRGLQTPHP